MSTVTTPNNTGNVTTVTTPEVIPPLLFSNDTSKFNVVTKNVSLNGSLKKTVRALINTINSVEPKSVILVEYKHGIQFNDFEPIKIPNVNAKTLHEKDMDMDMVANYINLYIDHAYFFRSNSDPAKFDPHKTDEVNAIRSKIVNLFTEIEIGPQNIKVIDESLIGSIAAKIEKHYGEDCIRLFFNTTTCSSGVANVLTKLIGRRHRSDVYLSLLVHYILSRILVARGLDAADMGAMGALQKEMTAKERVTNSSSTMTSSPTTEMSPYPPTSQKTPDPSPRTKRGRRSSFTTDTVTTLDPTTPDPTTTEPPADPTPNPPDTPTTDNTPDPTPPPDTNTTTDPPDTNTTTDTTPDPTTDTTPDPPPPDTPTTDNTPPPDPPENTKTGNGARE